MPSHDFTRADRISAELRRLLGTKVHEAVRALSEIGYSVVAHNDGELSTDYMCSTLYRRLTFETTFSRQTGLRNQPEFLVDLQGTREGAGS